MSRLKALLGQLPRLKIEAEPPRPLENFTFTLFPELPVELRNKIWKFVAFQPRFVELIASDLFEDPTPTKALGQSRIPPILHTCCESRLEAMRYYTMCYKKPTSDAAFAALFNEDIVELKRDIIFVNFKVDRFLHERMRRTSTNIESYDFDIADLKKIQILEIRSKQWWLGCKVILSMKDHLKDVNLILVDWSQGKSEESVEGHLLRKKHQEHCWKELERAGGKVKKRGNKSENSVMIRIRWENLSEFDLCPSSSII